MPDEKENSQTPDTRRQTPEQKSDKESDNIVVGERNITGVGLVRGRGIEKEMQESYLDYAMSVIVARALPDVRDGLKPVHRRILYAMHELGLRATVKFRKSATVVGEVLGKYHPHGDIAVYDSLVRMAQNFSMRYPLVDGQGNFGSMDGDSPAAMRYCVTGDTLLFTDQGIIPIEKISTKIESKIDLQVINYQGKIKKASKFFNSGKHKIIKIITQQGYEIAGSYNHPILCWAKNKAEEPKKIWKLLENITQNDYIVLNRNFPLFSNKELDLQQHCPRILHHHKDLDLPKSMNYDLAFLLGALVSEGSFHNKQILFNNKDKDFYNKIKGIINKQFKGIKLYERKIKGGCWELSIHNQKAVRFLVNIGLTNVRSDFKEIPFSVLISKKEYIKAFLIGLFEGDGSISCKIDKRHQGESVELTYNSKSKKLIKQLKILLINFGTVTTFPYQDKRNACYKLIISGQGNIKQFAKKLAFSSERKQALLTKASKIKDNRISKIDFIPYLSDYFRNKYKSIFLEKNNFDRYNNLEKNYSKIIKIISNTDKKLLDEILKNKFFFNQPKIIEKLKENENVYSIRVNSKCHSFVANGFVNHNTECRMTRQAEEMMMDIEKRTVLYVPNYDGTREEPQVLPAKLPQLLLNGALGIAVGMATNIPPHNLGELVAGITHLIDNPEATTEELMEFITGPDFPTGGVVYGKESVKTAYSTGRGKIIIRGVAGISERAKGGYRIIISQIPYQVNKSVLITRIAELVKLKKIEGISDIRDESDRKEGVRIVIDLKHNAFAKKILNKLYELTDLQTAFHFNMLALIEGLQPRLLTLKNILEEFIKHRQIVIRKRIEFELMVAKERAHILEGLKKALDHIDEVIAIIKKSQTKEIAHKNLISKFSFSNKQGAAILEMRLATLAGLERKKIDDELAEKLELIKKLKAILASELEIKKIIKNELKELSEKYADERRTKIMASELGEFKAEDLVPNEQVIVTLTAGNYIKRVPISTYQSQHRGGKGKAGMTTQETDTVTHLLVAWTHDEVMFFTDRGRVFASKVFELPSVSRQAKGQAIVNILQLMPQEKVTAILPIIKTEETQKYFFMATELGVVKRTEIAKYQNIRKTGIIAMKLRPDDKLKWVMSTAGNSEITMVTQNGQSIHYKESDARSMGRSAGGVRGIKLRQGDKVIATDAIENEDAQVFTILENGYGKRTSINLFTLQKRGGIGIRASKVNKKTGKLAGAEIVYDVDGDVVLISTSGQVIRLLLKSVKKLTRDTQGVRLMRLNSGDKVASMTVFKKAKEIEEKTSDIGQQKPDESAKAKIKKQPLGHSERSPQLNSKKTGRVEESHTVKKSTGKNQKNLFQPKMKKIITFDEVSDFKPVLKAKKIISSAKPQKSKIEVKRYRKMPDHGKTRDIDQSKYILRNKSEPNYWGKGK